MTLDSRFWLAFVVFQVFFGLAVFAVTTMREVPFDRPLGDV